MYELYQLEQRQSLPLESKIRLSMMRIRAWYARYGEDLIAVVDNGSAQSKVLMHMCRDLDPDAKIVYPSESGRYNFIVPFMVGEDPANVSDWLAHGCNFYNSVNPQCRPLSVWLDKDILRYDADVIQKSF